MLESSARVTRCDELDTISRAVPTENIHLYRKDRQWIAVKHSGHKVTGGEQIDEHIFHYNH